MTRLSHALALALSAGLAAGGCDQTTPNGGTDTDTDVDTDTDAGTEAPTTLVGTTPADLATVCAADHVLEHVVLDEPVNYLSLRRVEDYGQPDPEVTVEFEAGVACDGASDAATCLSELDATRPGPSGWGYCGEGCSDSGLVTTVGDTVSLYDATDEVVDLFGEIDNAADALFLVVTQEYTPECDTVVETEAGAWRMRATFTTSDCPWTDEVREIEVARDGTTTVLQVVEVIDSDLCAGRLPNGVCTMSPVSGDAVAAHLAHLAWLEAAAVIAFEHLALDLEQHGAPAALVARARQAADDEVRHAARMTEAAIAYGGVVPPVQVQPRTERTLFEVARLNATEGCVRETFGVVDALYRSRRAPTAELRTLFADIARDETRHAQLSWDIAAWAAAQLSKSERADIDRAQRDARERLVRAASQRDDTVAERLGAPSAAAAVAMAQQLNASLAA